MSQINGPLRFALVAIATVFCLASLYAIVTYPLPVWTVVFIVGLLVMTGIGAALVVRRPDGAFFEPLVLLLPGLIVGRLLSTAWLIPAGRPAPDLGELVLAETGPGIPFLEPLTLALVAVATLYVLAQARRSITGSEGGVSYRASDWLTAMLRAYLGLMFVSHFAGHVLAGPIPHDALIPYFGSVGMPFPSASIAVAGVVEIAVCIGLAFGFMTRPLAALGAFYLLFAVGIGGHFSIGYSWALPGLGWEFPTLWAFAVALFAVFGAGPISLDAKLGIEGTGSRLTTAPRRPWALCGMRSSRGPEARRAAIPARSSPPTSGGTDPHPLA